MIKNTAINNTARKREVRKRYFRKSQVTLFIILGLLILVAGGIFMYMKASSFQTKASLDLVTEQVPQRFKPVQVYITQCLDTLSHEALIKVGLNGGYIDPLDPEYSPFAMSGDEANPTEGDVLKTGGEQNVPYWYYMDSPNECKLHNCSLVYSIPSLELIQSQIELYVNLNLKDCIQNFTAFKEQGLIVSELSQPNTTVLIGEFDIVVQLEYHVEAKKDEESQTMNFYSTKIPLNFKEIYSTAAFISSKSALTRFLEKSTIYLISLHQSFDASSLPPFYSSSLGMQTSIWSNSLVTQKVQDLISTYTPLIRIENTQNGQKLASSDAVEQSIMDFLYMSGYEQEWNEVMKNYRINFHYWNWPLYLDIRPRDGDVIRPSTVDISLQNIGGIVPTNSENTYSFKYDISYPVLVELTNKDAFDGQGYSFFFALESNIRNNYDLLTSKMYTPVELFPENAIQFEHQDKLLGDTQTINQGDEEITIPMPKRLPSNHIFCNEKQMNGPKIDFIVKDMENSEAPMKDVAVFYQCGPLFSCRLGITDEKGALTAKLPICTGGAIRFESFGYVPQYVIYDSNENMPNDFKAVGMYKPKVKKIKVKFIDINDLDAFPDDKLADPKYIKQYRNMNSHEMTPPIESTLFLILTKVRDSSYSEDYIRLKNINYISSFGDETIDLVPAIKGYEITATYINNTDYTTKSSEECPSWEPLDICTTDTITYPSQFMKDTIEGSLTLSEEVAGLRWKVDYEELADTDKDTVVFYLLWMEAPEYTKDLKDMGKFQEYMKKYRYFLLPEFVSSAEYLPGTGG